MERTEILFLAVERAMTFMAGTYENVIGVYSTPELAEAALKESLWFDRAEKTAHGWRYDFDGELSMFWEIEDITIDRPRRST